MTDMGGRDSLASLWVGRVSIAEPAARRELDSGHEFVNADAFTCL
jgi:hypothetical protein